VILPNFRFWYHRAMQTLSDAIAAALREVERGLAIRRAEGGLALAPQRVQLNFHFALDGGVAHASPTGPHSVSIEIGAGTALAATPTLASAMVNAVSRVPAAAVIESADGLAAVFGAPGFDSSARATVFRETLEGMSDEEARAVMVALQTPLAEIPEESRRRAVHILRGVILSGPAKQLERGAAVLRNALAGRPLLEVLRHVEATWKTQDDWLG
jgi:hypothetical protein